MSSRQQRRELKQLAEQLRKSADAIEAISGRGQRGLNHRERVEGADGMIDAGATLFYAACEILRSGKQSEQSRTAADRLEATATAWRPAGPS